MYKTTTLLYFASTIHMPNSASKFELPIIATDFCVFQNSYKCFLNCVSSVVRDLTFAIGIDSMVHTY